MKDATHTVHLSEVRAMPWKNGGGVTRELLAWPSADDWSIRVSVADIERDGPFSSFPGVERHFAVLEGEGVELGNLGFVRAGDEPVKFDGDLQRDCRLLAGRTRDLNVMIRTAHGHGSLRKQVAESEFLMANHATVYGYFSWPEGRLAFATSGDTLPTPKLAGDTLVFHFAFLMHETDQS